MGTTAEETTTDERDLVGFVVELPADLHRRFKMRAMELDRPKRRVHMTTLARHAIERELNDPTLDPAA